MNDDYYTLEETAKMLKTTRQNLLNWRKQGILKVVKIKKRVLVKKEEIERLIKENEI